uniref:Uncharacterized protein n=1 Tax=Panagrellus redivivus TaxID=6233 RepID=A0A7E4VX93_PANRE
MKQPTAPFSEAIIAPPIRTSSMFMASDFLNTSIISHRTHAEPLSPYRQYYIPPHEIIAQNSFPSTCTVSTDASASDIRSRNNTLELNFEQPKKEVVKTTMTILKPKWYKSLLCWGLPTYMKVHAARLQVPADEFESYNKMTFNELSALAMTKVDVRTYFYCPESLDMLENDEYTKK